MTKTIIYTLLLAAAPVSELRGAIPYAMSQGMIWYQAFTWAVIGNMIPVFLILWFIDPVSKFLMAKSKFFNKFLTKFFEYTRNKHAKKIEVYKEIALITFVAIPLPLTGAWSGALVAFLFGLDYKKAIPLIFLGVVIAGLLVSLASAGFINLTKIGI